VDSSSPPGRSVKWGRLIVAAVLSILAITIALSLFDYTKIPGSIVKFYYFARYGVNIGDGGILSGVPCSAPCVFGIRAGETKMDQVMSALEKNGIPGSKCLTEPNVSWFLFTCGAGRLTVQVNTQANMVNAVSLHPNASISLGEIIEKYGKPDYVTLDQEAPGTTHPRFYWNSIRMLVTLPEISGAAYDIERAAAVEGVDFSDEALYRAPEKKTDPYYRPWNGYGIYRRPAETIPAIPMPTATMTQ
jgi:hypothetical protein